MLRGSQCRSSLGLRGIECLQDALRDLRRSVTNNRERIAPGGPVCRMTVGPLATQAKAPKPRRELGNDPDAARYGAQSQARDGDVVF